MSIEKQINSEILEAMKAKDEFKLTTLRSLKTAISVKKTEENGSTELTDTDILGVINKSIKDRKKSADFYKETRQDLYDIEMGEIDILNSYLPAQLTESDVLPIVEKVIEELQAKTVKEMGLVMKHPSILALNGQIDTKTISMLIKNKLS